MTGNKYAETAYNNMKVKKKVDNFVIVLSKIHFSKTFLQKHITQTHRGNIQLIPREYLSS